ncbi:hypothetical protein DWW91_14180 [Parabacteroides sp. AF17-3]|nr:hypothetical protein DWW91_14180 [Parabacteroides sp. AF17-3]
MFLDNVTKIGHRLGAEGSYGRIRDYSGTFGHFLLKKGKNRIRFSLLHTLMPYYFVLNDYETKIRREVTALKTYVFSRDETALFSFNCFFVPLIGDDNYKKNRHPESKDMG